MRYPDIELTTNEQTQFAQIRFGSTSIDDIRASIVPMVALAESLIKRSAIPEVRLLYFTDPERNPSGRGQSRQGVFERTGTSGPEILAHPHFMKHLEYFICGPHLPAQILQEFKEAARFSGYLTGGDVSDLIPKARAVVRATQMNPHDAADEFQKLVLECGGMPSSAESVRKAVRLVKLSR